MNGVVIYGAGGHGRVVLDALEKAGRTVLGFVDDAREAEEVGGYPIYTSLEAEGLTDESELIVAIGDGAAREAITRRALEAGRVLATAIHPGAEIGRDVKIGAGAMALAQTAINAGARLGVGVIINTAATVDHECRIGDFAHIAPGARLAGNVGVGTRALIGIGAAVLPNVEVGADAIVGAGAVVTRDVPPETTVAGVPARPLHAPAPSAEGQR